MFAFNLSVLYYTWWINVVENFDSEARANESLLQATFLLLVSIYKCQSVICLCNFQCQSPVANVKREREEMNCSIYSWNYKHCKTRGTPSKPRQRKERNTGTKSKTWIVNISNWKARGHSSCQERNGLMEENGIQQDSFGILEKVKIETKRNWTPKARKR